MMMVSIGFVNRNWPPKSLVFLVNACYPWVMSDKDIFSHLFQMAVLAKDPRGVVAVCLIENGNILISATSADDGIRHAEDIVLEKARNSAIHLSNSVSLYSTLEP